MADHFPSEWVITLGRNPHVSSVMCAVYDCVVRHSRFVDTIVADQGSEFASVDLSVAYAYLRASSLDRPPSKPRFGALIERLFGSLKARLIDELSGSVDTIARSRELSSTHDPQRHALWSLPALSRLLETFLFETYPALVHSELGTTPREVFAHSMAHAGERVARHVPLDDNLSLALSETVPGSCGTRTVPKVGGLITVAYQKFHHPDFSDDRVRGRAIPVRRSPADASFVYVYLPHRKVWERARLVSGSVDLTGCSWRQARALIEENARQHLIASLGAAQETNALVLSDILLSVDEYEREALKRRRAVDTEERLESSARLGGDSESHPSAGVAHPLTDSEAPSRASLPVAPPSLGSPLVRSYDEDPD